MARPLGAGVNGTEGHASRSAGDRWDVTGQALRRLSGKPGEGHCLDPVGWNATLRRARDGCRDAGAQLFDQIVALCDANS